ncbi:MAG: isoleucine--tRNA ligase [Armatimonadetes bacterium 55-13]|nr:isoleucine--tRNA ligase [Armatimonadota bacterium]OJU64017.1 MAG: isoleucine--tRNA ligase [Armatimonadetes bacterium 55-13]
MDFRQTLNLPDPDFTIPMKAGLPSLEPQIQSIWDSEQIYHKIQASRKDAPSFVLHDGPPYTNSPIHIGTALNKILKDFVVKSRTMMGFRAPYVPGFDNHGLPIEQTVMKAFQEKKQTPSVLELRKACRAHAATYIDVQTSQFKRLGVFGLWERPYATMDYGFEAEIVRTFKRMAEGGYIYKGLRPTLWSPTSRTALADTEIVYHDHVSKAIYVRFPLLEDPNQLFTNYPNLYTVIWTTTPWTIPANLAVAFHPEFVYAIAKVGDEHYLLLKDLLPKVAEKVGWAEYEIVAEMDGINFDHTKFKHPIFERASLGVVADYITTEDGTGVVHTAPSHGRDDFYTGLKYNLPVPNTVDEGGVLTAETGEFEGTYYKKCDTVVVDRLQELGMLLSVSDYSHSYPYAERDGQPVIFRATEQWFVGIDQHGLRTEMLEAIQPVALDDFIENDGDVEGVSWVPEQGYNRIDAMVKNRPDWCISRQRPWGVGIPVFYGKQSRTPVLDPVAIEAVAQLVEREGSDAWFEKDASEILPAGYKHPETGETEFDKETDVLDVWFDSGSTSLCVLEGNVEPRWKENWPADLYLEGSDQHRGWFNSSLVIGVATRGEAPYKQVVTHGFITDDQGRKMSKRLGNVVDPVVASEQYGADVLRYWVASVDYANDAPCSDALLKQFGEGYRSVRNTLRFLLGNLSDYEPVWGEGYKCNGGYVELLELDEWVVEQVDLLVAECVENYRRYDFGAVITAIHNFCAVELSRFYLDAIKDRMYCDGTLWPSRQSGQVACHYVLVRLVKLLAPILVHTCEETWKKVPGVGEDSVHVAVFDIPSDARMSEIEGSPLQTRFAALLAERANVFAAFEPWKAENGVKDSQDVVVSIREEGETLELLKSFESDVLANYMKMSWVELSEGPREVSFRKSEYEKCERSRLRRPDVEKVTIEGEDHFLTARDRRALDL